MKHLMIALVALMGLMITPASAQQPTVAQVSTGIENLDEAVEAFITCVNVEYQTSDDEIVIETMEVRGFINEEPCTRMAFYMSTSFRAEAYQSYTPATAEAIRLWYEFIENDPALRNRVDHFGEQLESSTMDDEPYIERLRGLHRAAMGEEEEESSPHQFAGVTHAPQRGFCFTSDNLEIPAMVESEAHCRSEGLYWFNGTLDERETHLGR